MQEEEEEGIKPSRADRAIVTATGRFKRNTEDGFDDCGSMTHELEDEGQDEIGIEDKEAWMGVVSRSLIWTLTVFRYATMLSIRASTSCSSLYNNR